MRSIIFNMSKTRYCLLAIQLVIFILFVISHFLGWAWGYIAFYPQYPRSFLGVDLKAGKTSILFMTPILMTAIANVLFFFTRKRKDHQTASLLVHNFAVTSYLIIFIDTIASLFEISHIHFDSFTLGFYLWIFTAIMSLGLLIALNVSLYRHRFASLVGYD